MKNGTIAIIFAFILAIPLPVAAGWFGPSNYDECILDSMKGVSSDTAARMIRGACRTKFPKETKKGRVLSSGEIANITGRAAVDNSGVFKGHIYNGNKDIVITQITIRLTPKSGDGPAPLAGTQIRGIRLTPKSGDGPARDYNADVTAPPLTSKDIWVDINAHQGSEYSWSILSARGYRQ